MKTLVTGGAGFIGSHLVERLLGDGHDVTVINRGQTPSDLPESVTRLIGDRHGDMSALAGTASARVVIMIRSSGRLTARPKITGVVSGRWRRNRSSAAPSCQGRARDSGL